MLTASASLPARRLVKPLFSLVRLGLCLGAVASALLPSGPVRAADDPVLVSLHTFAPDSEGSSPESALTLDKDGNLYGTTYDDGLYGGGSLFRISPTGTFDVLHSFGNGKDGQKPSSKLIYVPDSDTFVGTTVIGGSGNSGTLYVFSPAQGYFVLNSFHPVKSDDGVGPVGDLVYDTASNTLFGLTREGGTNGVGTAYYLLPAQAYQRVANYSALNSSGSNPEGADPRGGLVRNDANSFFGTALQGGVYAHGTVDLISVGSVVAVHSFNGDDGTSPVATLAKGTDGNFYGTTYLGGANNAGTIFRVTPAGLFTSLYSFPALDANQHNATGGRPVATMILGSDGVLYGTTTLGGTAGNGTIYRLSADGTPTVLHSFTADEGSRAYNSPIQDGDGNLCGALGTTPTTGGRIYKLVFLPEITSPLAAMVTVGQPFSYQITATHGIYPSFQMDDPPAGLTFNDKTGLLSGTPAQAGTYNLTFSVVNDAGPTSAILALTVLPNIPTATLTATVPSVTVGSGLKAEFTVTLSAAQAQDTLVNYVAKGTAVNGTDYALLKGKVKVKAGKTSKAVKINPLGDLRGATKRIIKLNLTNGTGYTADTAAKVKVKILKQP